jgi:hypothetical protein
VTRRALGLALLALALSPAVAEAHGLVGREDTAIPAWLFGWAAAIVLAASFAAMKVLWPKPRLQEAEERRLVRIPRGVDAVCGAIGIFCFAVVVYAGFAGDDLPTANLAPTAIYIIFWVGIPIASALFGDVFRAFNPWRSVAVAARPVLGRLPWRTREYPERLGRWPAVAGILGFAWLELAYGNGNDEPALLAAMAVAYAAIQLAGMATFGIDAWSERGDAFGVYFNLFARLSPWVRREGVVYRRPVLGGAPGWRIVPGSVALLCVAIGSTSFDGFSVGPAWADIKDKLVADVGLSLRLTSTIGLLLCIGIVALLYRLGIEGMRTVGRGHTARDLLGRFAHSLIPIAFAYAVAHYFSSLVFQGQALGYLISDPLGDGSDIFGTAGKGIDYGVMSGDTIWYIQVGALVCGHVAGLMLAHDRALSTYSDVGEATRSQYWMLVVMVGFTSLGLWLLSAR